jgi:uncharacterized protein (DUF1330 family)
MRRRHWVACYRAIANPQALRNYSALAGPAIEAAGGSFLSRGIAVAAQSEAGLMSELRTRRRQQVYSTHLLNHR